MVKASSPLIVALALAIAAGGCDKKKAAKDEWETGKYVPPPEPAKKLPPLPTFSCSAAGKLKKWRYGPVVSALPGGRVLVAGGRQGKAWLDSAEIFDPATGKSESAAPMKQRRVMHGALRLTDGRVLVYGGGSKDLELFDPAKKSWRAVGRVKKDTVGIAAVQLSDGSVFLAGGDLTDRRALSDGAFRWNPGKRRVKVLTPLKVGVKGEAFLADGGEVVLLAKQGDEERRKLLRVEPGKGELTPYKSDKLLFKALQEMGRMKGGNDVVLAYGPDGKPTSPPTGLRKKVLLRFFPSRMSWRTLARLEHDHSGGATLALSPDKILVVGGSDAEKSSVEICTAPGP